MNLYDIKQGSSPKRPDRLWGLRSLLFNWHWGSFPGAERRGQDLEQKRPPSVKVKKKCSNASTALYTLHGADREDVTILP